MFVTPQPAVYRFDWDRKSIFGKSFYQAAHILNQIFYANAKILNDSTLLCGFL